jgi:hypothetical protein
MVVINDHQRKRKKPSEYGNPIKNKTMEGFKIQYKNATFPKEKIELDGKSFNHCTFKNCIIVLERGETNISNCRVENCKLVLRGNAYTVGKIIKLFTGKSPLKVLDLDEPLFEVDAQKNP